MTEEIRQPRADEIDWWRIADAVSEVSSVEEVGDEEVRNAFGELLDLRVQHVVALRFERGKSHSFAEIAKILGHTEGWARNICGQALVTMRQHVSARRECLNSG